MNTTQYWIMQNGNQTGPVDAEQLRAITLSENDYIWRSGLADWIPVNELPELESLNLNFEGTPATPIPPIQPQQEPEQAQEPEQELEQEQAQEPEQQPEPEPEPAGQIPPMPEAAPEPPIIEGVYSGDPTVAVGTPTAAMGQQQPQPATNQPEPPQTNQHAQQAWPKCPPTNMVWAVLATVLCCVPLGIVAIVYSTKVSKHYYAGEFERAEHYSEVSAWWCIGAIVGGIILSPFVSLIQMIAMS